MAKFKSRDLFFYVSIFP